MLKRTFPIALLSLALAADAAAQSAVPDSRPTIGPTKPDFFNRVIANQKKGEAALDLYERIERVETRKNPNDTAPAAIKIMRVIPSGTGMFRIPLSADGKPRDSSAYRADLENLVRTLTLLASDAGSQREALEKYAKKKKERNDLIDSTHNAFLFTFVATRFTSIFPKVRGFVWIDEASGELARIEGEVTEDISVGLFLGKIYKGSHFMQERYEFLPGLWLASFSQYDFDGRKLFSGFSVHERTFYSNYRYIGPPKEALAAIRLELGHAELDKPRGDPADQ